MPKYTVDNSTELKYELVESLDELGKMYLELKQAVVGKEKLEHEETVQFAKKLIDSYINKQ